MRGNAFSLAALTVGFTVSYPSLKWRFQKKIDTEALEVAPHHMFLLTATFFFFFWKLTGT